MLRPFNELSYGFIIIIGINKGMLILEDCSSYTDF